MPQPKKRKSIRQQLEDSYVLCQYCKAHRPRRGFNKHRDICKAKWDAQRRKLRNCMATIDLGQDFSSNTQHEDNNPLQYTEDPMCVDEEHRNPSDQVSQNPIDRTSNSSPDAFYGPKLPDVFIKIIPHPHSKRASQILPLSGGLEESTSYSTVDHPENSVKRQWLSLPDSQPWTPFRTLADFEYTETVVKGLLNKDLINRQLAGIHNGWCGGECNLTIKTYRDMKDSLGRARAYVVRFQEGTVTKTYKGVPYTFTFQFRDPWECILNLIHDDSLASASCWHSVRKFYCSRGGDREERIYDEPNTGDTWWEVDSSLPGDDVYPHAYLPLHFWLDKGLVTRRVKKHPMVLRAAWLPRNIRNASGNGGGVLIGYMPIVEDPADPNNVVEGNGEGETVEFGKFKREIYQSVLARVFKSLSRRSRVGEANVCNDQEIRILHPGILIESLDGEESSCFCACKAANADYPCPKCLVSRFRLHDVTAQFEKRTITSMRRVYEDASRAITKTAKESILQAYGLHDVKHFLWDFSFSDPYAACSYDTLHSDDLGKWGKHLWPLLLKVLDSRKCAGKLSENMRMFPTWPNLKHFKDVSKIPFTDGQTVYDILKCILPCIVQLLPRNSPLVHCVRSYQRYRIMIGLRCMTEGRLSRLAHEIKKYKDFCSKVTQQYGKNYDFFKQHYVSHVILDIRQKGTTDNTSTRPGEGFQQEASQAYAQTNGKKAEAQMVVIDENQEAIARIRMTIDRDNEAKRQESADDDEATQSRPKQSVQKNRKQTCPQDRHWDFGSQVGKRRRTKDVEEEATMPRNDFYRFDERLRAFLASHLPEEAPQYDEMIYVEFFNCIYLWYQSKEDWSEARDLLRCNSEFNEHPRYDCVMINTDAATPTVARLRALIRCRLPSGKTIDLALARFFATQNKWKPATKWEGCQIRIEEKDASFVLAEYMVRGALMCPVFEDDRVYYIMDTIDGDMFLRVNDWE